MRDVMKREPTKKAKLVGKNFPKNDDEKAEIGKLLNEVLIEANQPKCKTDEELAQRIGEYFKRCAETGQTPTIEEMALSTGYTDTILAQWERDPNIRGLGNATALILSKARHILKTFDAKMVISGKLNFLAYCFRSKNYYGMVDKQDVVVTPSNPPEMEYSADEIRKRYELPTDENGGLLDE